MQEVNNPGKLGCQLAPRITDEGHMLRVTCECGLDYLTPKIVFSN